MVLAKVKYIICILVGLLAVLICLSRLPLFSLPEDAPCSATSESRNNTPYKFCYPGAVTTARLSFPRRTVTRQLVDGSLPLDPSDNRSTRIFHKDFPEHNCSQYKTRFGLDLPQVWLASFPRSGNTWTRYLLEAASGVFTGSVYSDQILFYTGYLGEWDPPNSRRTLVQKTHSLTQHNLNKFDSLFMRFLVGTTYVPTVLLLRNPAKSILSFYKFMKNRHHPSRIPASEYENKEFSSFVKMTVKWWTDQALNRLLETEAPLYVMHYERLLEDPIKELAALLAFLGVPRHEERLACLSLQLEGTFKSEESEPRDPYTFEEKVMMAAEARTVNSTLQLLGYSPLPSYPDWPIIAGPAKRK
ncbi:WSC domain-containing protein 1-like isoform X2 [Eriocheir sinensis]|nr:WSC domain-containing protein 1-like isoform X2 [Eriocheir sinensis]XP_050687513.1 WSC domain-containing protein 1-like isoform X2 [Eriocheir sinensis]